MTEKICLQDAEAAQREVLERAEARAAAAEHEAAAEKEQRRRVMDAAAKGSLPVVALQGLAQILAFLTHACDLLDGMSRRTLTTCRRHPGCSKWRGLEPHRSIHEVRGSYHTMSPGASGKAAD